MRRYNRYTGHLITYMLNNILMTVVMRANVTRNMRIHCSMGKKHIRYPRVPRGKATPLSLGYGARVGRHSGRCGPLLP